MVIEEKRSDFRGREVGKQCSITNLRTNRTRDRRFFKVKLFREGLMVNLVYGEDLHTRWTYPRTLKIGLN